MLSDKIWNRPSARWIALFAYIAGVVNIGVSVFTDIWWQPALTLVVWIIPVTWCAYKYSKQGW